MAILKNAYPLILLMVLATGLTSCYTEFDPHIDSTPVLCMNSTVTPGEPVTLFLTRTWKWTEGNEYDLDLDVRNAEVRLIVNGEYKETLKPATVENPYHMSNPYPEQRKCYQSDYLPESGDIIRLEAQSEQYGDASAEVTVPYPVPFDRLATENLSCRLLQGDISRFPIAEESCVFELKFNLLAYLTDSAKDTDYYDIMAALTNSYDNDDETYAYLYSNNYPMLDFSGEPLLREHVSVLESAVSDIYGYSIFSDRQINGRTYPLRIEVNQFTFLYRNPLDLPGPKEFGIKVTLRHTDPVYYWHMISVWEGNYGITGALGGVGLASPVYPYSNVSTGAGTVAAYAEASLTISIADLIAIAQQGKNQ